jgi:hypothetical protein
MQEQENDRLSGAGQSEAVPDPLEESARLAHELTILSYNQVGDSGLQQEAAEAPPDRGVAGPT